MYETGSVDTLCQYRTARIAGSSAAFRGSGGSLNCRIPHTVTRQTPKWPAEPQKNRTQTLTVPDHSGGDFGLWDGKAERKPDGVRLRSSKKGEGDVRVVAVKRVFSLSIEDGKKPSGTSILPRLTCSSSAPVSPK